MVWWSRTCVFHRSSGLSRGHHSGQSNPRQANTCYSLQPSSLKLQFYMGSGTHLTSSRAKDQTLSWNQNTRDDKGSRLVVAKLTSQHLWEAHLTNLAYERHKCGLRSPCDCNLFVLSIREICTIKVVTITLSDCKPINLKQLKQAADWLPVTFKKPFH